MVPPQGFHPELDTASQYALQAKEGSLGGVAYIYIYNIYIVEPVSNCFAPRLFVLLTPLRNSSTQATSREKGRD